MHQLLLTDSFSQRLRAASTHVPPPPPRMAGSSLTAAALHAAAATWGNNLERAARDRAALLADLSLLDGRCRDLDRHTAHRLGGGIAP
ncbi:hypothetical protein H7347_04220 [Corynebacterium sp. zg-331]|uniref:hypothetical protein n=1 Tax=unclassified Corynebacterium TaxID=2624378 RepID=UPI00128DFCCC|nr:MULTISPECIES: hypothetical protein [unclassified Corynebacterium]MBC3185785.1 hypothetical protein [Corynebacterium sp. zg-331]MPV52278.1 hypothetical protein [Corynebacterium sp. zg331]